MHVQGTGWFKGTEGGKFGEVDRINPQVSAPICQPQLLYCTPRSPHLRDPLSILLQLSSAARRHEGGQREPAKSSLSHSIQRCRDATL